MKILIDISNSPHVLFFNPIIKELEKRGHEVIITAREHAQTLELLKIYGYKYELIGKHAGKNKFKKLLNALSRVFAIKKFIKQQKPDVCISHQSPYVIYAGFLSGIKRIYIFDNEHARLQNKLTFPAANKIICPEAITEFSGKKFVKYPGIKEAVYLRNLKIKDI
jgi:predicted glycosyltransferase